MPPQHHFEQQNIPKIIPRAAHCVAFFYLREVVMSAQSDNEQNLYEAMKNAASNAALEGFNIAIQHHLNDRSHPSPEQTPEYQNK